MRASRAMGGRPGGRREWAEYTPPLVATLDELNLGEVALATGSGGGCPGVGGLANRAPLARGAQRAPLLLCGAPAAAPVPRPAVGRRRRCSEARGGIGGKAGREDAERPGRRPRREQRRRPHGSARRRGCALVRHFGVQGKKRALCGRLLSKQAPLLSPQGYWARRVVKRCFSALLVGATWGRLYPTDPTQGACTDVLRTILSSLFLSTSLN